MTRSDGRSLVAAYLKALREARRVEQAELAARLGVHKNTVDRAEGNGIRATDKMETTIAITRALGGDVSHPIALRAGELPAEYPKERAKKWGSALTNEVAADVALWYVELVDADLAARAGRIGLTIGGVGELTDSFRWSAFQNPAKALKVYL